MLAKSFQAFREAMPVQGRRLACEYACGEKDAAILCLQSLLSKVTCCFCIFCS